MIRKKDSEKTAISFLPLVASALDMLISVPVYEQGAWKS